VSGLKTGAPDCEAETDAGRRSPPDVVRVRVAREAGTEDLPLPSYMTAGSSGMDLRAAVSEPTVLRPGRRAVIPTGLRLEIPHGYEGQVRPRSGPAARAGVSVLNSPGTIDSDYRGEVGVILINLGETDFTVRRGDRIAQLVLCPVTRAEMVPVDRLEASGRGEGGFGHTGGFAAGDSPDGPTGNPADVPAAGPTGDPAGNPADGPIGRSSGSDDR